MQFECARSGQRIEVGAHPERQWDVPGHGIFSAQQRSASDGAQGFLPPIGSTFNFATVPSQSHQPSHKALKAAFGAASISAPYNNKLARFAGPNEQRVHSANPLSIGCRTSAAPIPTREAPPRREHRARGGYSLRGAGDFDHFHEIFLEKLEITRGTEHRILPGYLYE